MKKLLGGQQRITSIAHLIIRDPTPTPVGNYNPDWAIAFNEDDVKHVYFVAETKGSMSSLELREIEQAKIKCANEFFDTIATAKVKYDVVDSYDKLIDLVR